MTKFLVGQIVIGTGYFLILKTDNFIRRDDAQFLVLDRNINLDKIISPTGRIASKIDTYKNVYGEIWYALFDFELCSIVCTHHWNDNLKIYAKSNRSW